MDRETKTKLLLRYVNTLEDNHGSVRAAEESGDKLFKEMREFVKLHFNDRDSEEPLAWGRGSRWTKKEEGYLIKHYSKKSASDIAKALGRSKRSVISKAHKMGISKQR